MADRIEELEGLLKAINHSIFKVIHDVAKTHQMAGPGGPVIREAVRNPGITVSEISRRTGMAKSHISKTVEGLAKAGFLEKRPDPRDQRRLRIYVTEHTMEQFSRVREGVTRRLSIVAAGLPPGKTDEIIEDLRVLQEALRQEDHRGGEPETP